MLGHNIDQGIRTQDVQISQDVTFQSMLLASNTLQGLKNSGFYRPSPVQLHGIPLGKCGFDLLLEAKSGTGKTAVFSVIALEKLDIDKGLQVVVLAPTREIASQICDVIKQIGTNYNGLVVEVVMGGLPVAEDIEKFKSNVHIVVGSPGRLRHLIQDKHIDVGSVRLLVLDEADKLMEKSFLPDINFIFSILPNQKQVIMSSATYPETTKTFINKYVKCAQHVCPDNNSVLLGVEQKITVVKSNANIVRQTQYRLEELLKILSHKQFKQCLIFCNYQSRVNELHRKLSREKWPVEKLSGQQEQSDRLGALKTLQEYKCRILICTDLAARGIDASNVDLVINFEPPFEWQTYLHRIGRAGRYGSYGLALTILSEGKEENAFKKIIELINLDASKMTNLWTCEDVDKNVEDESKSKIPIKKFVPTGFEDEYEVLCNTLASNLEIDKQIEDFDSLLKLYDESGRDKEKNIPLKMEDFSIKDLPICQYKKINPKLIQYFCNYFRSLSTDDDISNAVNINSDTKVKNVNNISKAPTDDESKQAKKYINGDSNGKNHVIKRFNQYTVNSDDDVEMDSTSRALLEAGLPLSFGSSKKCKTGKRKAKNVNLNRKNNYGHNETENDGYSNNYFDDDIESNSSNRALLESGLPLTQNVKNCNLKKEKRYKNNKKKCDQYSHNHSNDIELSSSSRALLESALPLSFGCSKSGKGMVKTIKEDNFKDVENAIIKPIKKSHATYKMGVNYKNTKTSQYVIKDTFVKGRNYSGTNNYNLELANNKGDNDKEKSCCTQSCRTTKISDVPGNYRQDYINWYKQLKKTVKCYELAFYIDEISKL